MMKSPRMLHKNLKIQISNNNKNKKIESLHSPIKKQLSNLPNAPERMVYKYTLEKSETDTLGIGIVGGLGTKLGGIFIKSIKEYSPCWNDGNLLVGDQIIALNGEDLREVSHEKAVTCFRECKKKVEIVISRMVESQAGKNERPLSPFHGRMYLTSSSFSEEPSVLEHKNIETYG